MIWPLTGRAVLGMAFTIKMVAYVGIAPIAGALVANLPRKAVLIADDLSRAAVALLLPFVTEVWQVYLLIFLLQTASATFTPTFQAVIPDILPDEREYTRALSLSRLAYDLENLISPAIAGLLLLLVSFSMLFFGTVIGFVGSALLVISVDLPRPVAIARPRPFRERVTRGARIYLATPRLRGLLALNMAAASVIAFALVNTVVMVRVSFAGTEQDVAVAMALFGGGSMLAALALPKVLEKETDRLVMLAGAVVLSVLALVYATILLAEVQSWPLFLVIWAVFGALFSTILTPSGRLLRRSAHAEDRSAIFTAQFALSHVCWLIAYPIAGWAGAAFGLAQTLGILGVMAAISVVVAMRVWPGHMSDELEHDHPDLPADHPHLKEHASAEGLHRHVIVIDDDHTDWPSPI